MANKYFRNHMIPAAGAETDMYIVPDANTSILSSLRVTNANTAPASITVSVYPTGGGSEYYLIKGYSLPANSTMDVFSGVPVVLEASDELTIESTVASVHFYLSYLEMDRN
jgi:hypothetical protein